MVGAAGGLIIVMAAISVFTQPISETPAIEYVLLDVGETVTESLSDENKPGPEFQ
jgi:hypothetical protein